MKRAIGGALFAVLLVAAIAGIWIYQQLNTLHTDEVASDVWMLSGLGSNVGVLRTGRGAVVVDTMTFRMQGERIRERVEALAGGEVELILNTHYHFDHTHGNPAFPAGLRIVATQRTLELMQGLDADYFSGDAAATLPNETFTDTHEVRIGGKTVRSFHLGRGHTDGDQVVLFVEDRVLHMGDLYFHRRYPNIDLEAGGSVREWVTTLDRVLRLEGYDRVIPGHGAVSDRAGIEQFQRFLRELWEQVEPLAAAGKTLEETRAAVRLTEDTGYEAIVIPGIVRLDRDFVVRRAWEEASGTVRKQVQEGDRRSFAAVQAGGR